MTDFADIDIASGLLPLNFNSARAQEELRDMIDHLPADVTMYIVGGAVRNALFRQFHGERLLQRDYDQVITNGSNAYAAYLSSRSYKEKPYPGRSTQTIYSTPVVENGAAISYFDNLVYDIHFADNTTIEDNLRYHAGFTVNGCAINARDIFTKPWREALIEAIPGSLQDLQNKQLRLNPEDKEQEVANFFAMLRFMSVGFLPPSHDEVQLLLSRLKLLDSERFPKNVTKIFSYVGGEEKARALVRQLGIEIDVFDEQVVKSEL